jgi:hypothetical protein
MCFFSLLKTTSIGFLHLLHRSRICSSLLLCESVLLSGDKSSRLANASDPATASFTIIHLCILLNTTCLSPYFICMLCHSLLSGTCCTSLHTSHNASLRCCITRATRLAVRKAYLLLRDRHTPNDNPLTSRALSLVMRFKSGFFVGISNLDPARFNHRHYFSRTSTSIVFLRT